MNHATFFKHFDLLADQPDAVAKMRGLIWQLAVQGKLLSQNSKDELATTLLEQIQAQKSRLTKKGEIRKTPILPPIEITDCPFSIPASWAWVHLNDLGDWGSGSTPERGRSEFYGGEIPWFKSGELNDGYISNSEETVTESALAKCSLRLNQPGDVLIAMYGATVGKVAILKIEATTNQAVCACTCFDGILNRFLLLLLKAYKQIFINDSAAAAQPNISKDKIIHTVAPLPPSAEQRRIVAKVDELMALCDELETQQQAKRDSRERLTASAFNSLKATKDSAEFRNRFNFVIQHSALVFDDVARLRQTILHLAVQGKLVEQDPKDGNGSQLLGQIGDVKVNLVAIKHLRKIEMFAALSNDQQPFNLPDSWTWTRLNEVFDVRDGTHDSPKYVSDGFPLVTSKNLYTGTLNLSDVKLISAEDHQQICNRSKVDRNDILFAMIGSIGNPVIVDVEPNFSIKNVALFKYYDHNLSEPNFLRLYLIYASERIKRIAAGGVQSFVSLGFLRKYPFPLPPLDEQRRIVARVDELMRQCDALEAQLAQTRTLGAHLLDSTLHHLLAA